MRFEPLTVLAAGIVGGVLAAYGLWCATWRAADWVRTKGQATS